MAVNSSSFRKEKILVIAGETGLGANLVQALQAQGYVTVHAKANQEGIQKMYDVLPHLIILDIVQADGEGYDVLARKNEEPLLSKIPVYLMSTQGTPINMQKVPAGSVAEFLLSYGDPKDIVARVDALFGYDKADAAAAEAAQAPKKKLLWVEDDKLIGSILSKKFSSSEFSLTHATSGDEALKSLDGGLMPDVVVLDLLLPGMNGFDILQKIRMNEAYKKIPVMILSNLSKESDMERAKLLGAQKFIVKAAASLDQIVAEVKELCK